MIRCLVTVFSFVAAAALPCPGNAQDGPYVAVELGRMAAPSMRLDGADNDWSTSCDLIIDPIGAETNGECDAPPPTRASFNEIDGAAGFLGSIAAGYAW